MYLAKLGNITSYSRARVLQPAIPTKMHPHKKSLIESHNALPLSAIRSIYLRPVSYLNNETHTVTLEIPSSVSSAAFTACFELVQSNMRDMYGIFSE